MLKIRCHALVTESVASHAPRVHQRRPCEHWVEDHGRDPALRAIAPPQVLRDASAGGTFRRQTRNPGRLCCSPNKHQQENDRRRVSCASESPMSCPRCSLTVPAVRTSCFAVVVGLCSFCHSLVTQQLCWFFFSCTLLCLSAPDGGVETLARATLARAFVPRVTGFLHCFPFIRGQKYQDWTSSGCIGD